MTRNDTRSIQQQLVDAGYNITVDGIWGPKTQAAYDDFQQNNNVKQDYLNYLWDPNQVLTLPDFKETTPPSIVGTSTKSANNQPTRNVNLQKDIDSIPTELSDYDYVLDKPTYFYQSGGLGFIRQFSNLLSVAKNYANGLVNPLGKNASLSEGGRRQLYGATLANGTGVSDIEHKKLGNVTPSGEEFREKTSMRGYLKQVATAPYHNVFGQSAKTLKDDGTISVGPDAYTYNNVWEGVGETDKNNQYKVTVLPDGRQRSEDERAGFLESIREGIKAIRSGVSLKAAMETTASIRGVDVSPNPRRTDIDLKQQKKYEREYQNYLNMSPEKRAKINRRLARIYFRPEEKTS